MKLSRFVKKRSTKVGLPPGTLVYIGEPRQEPITLTLITYNSLGCEQRQITTPTEIPSLADESTVMWLNVEGLHQVEVVRQIGDVFGLHPLVQEDILNTDQRPKIEDYDDSLYIVLKMLSFDEAEGIVLEQVSVILSRQVVLTFQEGRTGDVFEPVRERLRTGKGRIRSLGADFLAYSLMDAVVDAYFLILEKIGEQVELLQEEVVTHPTPHTLQTIHALKHHMILLRRSVWPLREVIGGLQRGDSPLVSEATRLYLRDVYDHTIHVIETVETFRDMLAGILDSYLSSLSTRLNEIMKVLTIIATIFMPLTFIVGIYGMNFRYMPELEWRWGYAAVWCALLLVGISMLLVFKRKKWL